MLADADRWEVFSGGDQTGRAVGPDDKATRSERVRRGVGATGARMWSAMAVRDLRTAFGGWRRRGFGRTIGTWALASFGVAVALIVATGLVATWSRPGEDYDLAGVSRPAELSDVRYVITRNMLVLTLHALACVAAYLARRSLPAEAARYGGFWRALSTRVGSAAMVFVALATVFSFVTQARLVGQTAATIAHHLGISPAQLLLVITPHALPELTAVFLPLAAWAIGGVRERRWNDLMAATLLSCAVAVPVIVCSAFVEAYVSPHLVDLVVR